MSTPDTDQTPIQWPTAEELAIRWHNTYEHLIGLKPEGRLPWRDMRPEYREAVVGTCRVLRAWLHDQIAGRLPVVAPSQGQDIPDDQLDAILEGAHRTGLGAAEWGRQAAHDAYRIGYAAALGYEITLDEGGRVGVGDRPEPAAPETLDATAAGTAGGGQQNASDLPGVDHV
jgi:hypothetical protein